MDILAGRVHRDRILDDGWLLGAGRGFVHLTSDGDRRTIVDVARPGTAAYRALLGCLPRGAGQEVACQPAYNESSARPMCHEP